MQSKVSIQSQSDVFACFGEANAPDSSFLETILEDLQDGVYVYDAESLSIRYMNAAARNRHGWIAEELHQRLISDTIANFDTDTFKRAMAPLHTGRQEPVVLEVVHPTGPVEISTRLMKIENEGTFYVSVLRDIACRKSTQTEKVQTVSTVSHELRTPLTSIHGALRLLKAGVVANLDDESQKLVDMAVRNTDRLLTIVNDILDLEKINSNKMDFSVSEMNIVDCVHDSVELVAGAAWENQVQLKIESDIHTAMVVGNPERIGQVVTNFASNAIKYSPEGGTVRFGIALDGDSIIVAVSDQGPGLAKDQYSTLFKPFSQARAADGRVRPGTGLGLAIVHAILERLEYPVDFRSEVGKGSTFFFRIPPHLVNSVEMLEAKETGAP